ncbi:MAG TPA: aspartate aminotransferase family protein, partial [Pseudonocardiaceae bacterium]
MNDLLSRTAAYANEYVSALPNRPVAARANLEQLRRAFDEPLPAGPVEPATVVDQLVAAAEPGVVATGSPRLFRFVIGGALPAALAADWLTSTWDQHAG